MNDHSLFAFRGFIPSLGQGVFVAPGARLIGQVEVADFASIWFNTVLRGDVGSIYIGERSNIQDLCMVHLTSGQSQVWVDAEVTVGHSVTLHGCTLRRGCLVGMGATVLDGAEVGEQTIVAAGSVVPPGAILPPKTLCIGSPARPRRALTDVELERLSQSAPHYAALAADYVLGLSPVNSP